MIRVSALYPNGDDTTFDHDYYQGPHLKLLSAKWGSWLRRVELGRGLAGGGGSAAPYIACGHLYFDSVDDFQAAFAAHGDAVLGDIPNFTNAQPVIQISEIGAAGA